MHSLNRSSPAPPTATTLTGCLDCESPEWSRSTKGGPTTASDTTRRCCGWPGSTTPEEIDSDEDEQPAVAAGAIDGDVAAVHHPHVGFQVIGLAVAACRRADVIGQCRETVVISHYPRFDVQPFERHFCERQRHPRGARREDVYQGPVGKGAAAGDGFGLR